MYFRNIVLSSFAIAMIAGLIFSAYQSLLITPIIVNAETYELTETIAPDIEPLKSNAWMPEDGVERTFFTFLSSFLTSFGYALLLLSAMSLKGKINLLKGLCWGLAGFGVFFAAPGIGLYPEIPGMEAAALEGRQAWWLLTVLLTACALAMMVFGNLFTKLIGIALLLLPHLIGAPQPAHHGFSHPDPAAVEALYDLWQQFIIQTSIANALLWIIIGAAGAYFIDQYIEPIDKQA